MMQVIETIKFKKYFAFGEDQPPIWFRPGTMDETIIQHNVVEKRDYIFPAMEPRIIFDIGAHIGAMSCVLAQIYPMAQIYAFEPAKENLTLLHKNADQYKNISVQPYALGRCSGMARMWPSDDPRNFGGFSLSIQVPQAESTPVDVGDIAQVIRDFGTPDIIKIDVEGFEHKVITAIDPVQLMGVKWITGELHSGHDDFAVLAYLSKKNFDCQTDRRFGDVVYHFCAVNKDQTKLSPTPQS